MPDTAAQEETECSVDRALVLGPGGLAGTAWMAGLLHGLRHEGVDPGEADLVVGTSAGAIVAAALGAEDGLGRLADRATGDRPDPPDRSRDGRPRCSPCSARRARRRTRPGVRWDGSRWTRPTRTRSRRCSPFVAS
ncbi:patatin-like phospholipase family protein [Streptomyces sp. NPDC020472]|uniref:patatin-like phospholipase family protein n=1 Tax=Streptomyces sp. NPDC020472 TaxID=3365075 RepID=UPI00378A3B16